MARTSRGDVTRILQSWRDGRDEAVDELLPLVYEELRFLAGGYLRREHRREHTLQPTALVHEAYVRLLGDSPPPAKDRSHFLAIAARAMRRVLVDHARRHKADKRFGDQHKISLEDAPQLGAQPGTDIVVLHDLLKRLAEINPRQSQIVEMRFFGGLTNMQVAEFLGVSEGTVERDWHIARLWLRRRMSQGSSGGS